MFNPQILQRLLMPYILEREQKYGLHTSLGLQDPDSPAPSPKRVIVEFSSPNIASEFQSKHLRSTVLGAQIANLYSSMGWEVTRINYLGDWGKPVGLLGVGWEKFGSEDAFQSDPVGHLHEVYRKISDLFAPEQVASKKARDDGKDSAEIEGQGLFAERNAYFKRVEEGESEAIAFWKRVRDVSVENYTKLYARLNIAFDEYSGESQVSPSTMTEVEAILKEKGLLEESGGSSIIDMKKHGGKSGTVIIRDRAGSSTYFLRDLAAAVERSRKYSFDKMIYVVAADQHVIHFSRLFKILQLMGMADLASKLQHVQFNPTSQASAGVDMLGDVLDQCQTAMEESLQSNPEKATLLGDTKDIAAAMGVTALLAQELSTRRLNDHAFDISHTTSFESGTGPDLQYWYMKLCSMLEPGPSSEEFAALKISSHQRQDSVLEPDKEAVEDIKNADQISLLRILVQYPDITLAVYNTLEPATLMAYLVTITGQLSLCFESNKDCSTFTSAEKTLYKATKQVLENGTNLLGLTLSRR
jgi:arginyl-tRNA synthetase